MTFWWAAIIIVAIGAFSTMYRAHLKNQREGSDELIRNLIQRVNQLENRVSNLETIVLDREKSKAYKDL